MKPLTKIRLNRNNNNKMDPVTISLIIGVSILLIDRIYNWSATIIRSQCCCINITRTQTEQANSKNNIKDIGQLENEPRFKIDRNS